jgi:undecaprenyl-diphosphatase
MRSAPAFVHHVAAVEPRSVMAHEGFMINLNDMKATTVRAFQWLRKQNLFSLTGFCAVALLSLCFLEIADDMAEGDTHGIDRAILLALREPGDPANPLGGPFTEQTMIELTSFGDNAVLFVVTGAVALYLLLAGKRGLALLALGASISGAVLTTVLKGFFDRPRPDFVAHVVEATSASFPSGHAMMSAVVYLTLGGMLAAAQKTRRLQAFALGFAILLTLMVGFTRIYLGIHYPTDVLAGWALGGAWAITWMLAAFLLKSRGVSPASSGPR